MAHDPRLLRLKKVNPKQIGCFRYRATSFLERQIQIGFAVSLSILLMNQPAPAAGNQSVEQASSSKKQQDAVWFHSSQSDSQSTESQKLHGTIQRYDGDGLTLRSSTGRERTIPVDRVIRITSQWLPAHRTADELTEQKKFAAALLAYQEAERKEPRPWARQRIRAEIVRRLRNLYRQTESGKAFLALVSDDLDSPYFDTIPLAWLPGESVPKRQATEWMTRDDSPVAMLLGASHLMSTDQRELATKVLERLQADANPNIAALATAQLWRKEIVRADPKTIDQWRQTIDAMPESLRAGPYYLLGLAQLRQGQHSEAAVSLMRPPILYPENRRLVAASLIAAGDALVELGRQDQAIRLFREVETDYDFPRWKAEASRRLRGLTPKARG